MAIKPSISLAILKNLLTVAAIASGVVQAEKPKPPNIQCVKITREHDSLISHVTYWCSFRLNQLQRMGIDSKVINSITQQDARFLTALSHALATQKEKEPTYDGWLFFNNDVKETCFFELTQCRRGTKDMMSTLIIHSDR